MGVSGDLTMKIRCHRAVGPFDYDITVDWAIDLIKSGKESDNILMLASFTKPVDSQEIKPYVSAVLTDLYLKELTENEDPIEYFQFYMLEIIAERNIKANVDELFDFCLQYDHSFGLTKFYLLHFAWEDLVYSYENHYYDGATLDNIEQLAQEEAQKWINEYVKGNTA